MNSAPINVQSSPPARATQSVNKEAVRMLVAEVGYNETAQRLGINADRIRQWAHRGQWNVATKTDHRVSQLSQSPATAHADILAEMESETRISLSRYARKAAGAINKSVHPAKWTKEAHDIAKTAGLVHGWGNEKGQAGFSLNVLNLGQLQIGVQTDSADDTKA